MSKGWYGNKMGHSLASRGIKSRIVNNYDVKYQNHLEYAIEHTNYIDRDGRVLYDDLNELRYEDGSAIYVDEKDRKYFRIVDAETGYSDIPDFDVFLYIENIVMKKSLDDFEWYFSGYSKKEQKEIMEIIDEDLDEVISPIRSKKVIQEILSKNYDDIIDLICVAENISKYDVKIKIKEYENILEEG